MKMIGILVSASAILSLASTHGFAQAQPNAKKACAADMQKFCPNISDRHAARQCMMGHMADMSPDCHAAIEAARAARAARKAEAPPAAGAPPTDAPH